MFRTTTAVRAIALGACLATLGATMAGADPGVKLAGPAGDGTAVTPVGFRITPAGTQVRLGDLPLSAALTPDGQSLLVSNDGQAVQSLQVVDAHSGAVRQTIEYRSPEALFVGLAITPDGAHAYASAGGNNKIRRYDLSGGSLTETASIPLPKTNPAGVPVNMYPAGLALTADGHRLVVADQLADAATVVDLDTNATHTVAVGHRPYGVVVNGSTAYVTNQGADTVSVLDISGAEPVVTAAITVGTHPNSAILDPVRGRVYVADGDSDEVSVIDGSRVVRTIRLAPYPGAPVGSNPDALALSADGRTLYVANSGNNDVDVVNLNTGWVQGKVPTAWYPTAVVATGDALYVANAKGLGAGPNTGPGFPNPNNPTTASDQYVGSMMAGTLSIVDLPISRDQLARYTRQVVQNNGFSEDEDATSAADAAESVVPLRAGGHTPIQHVIYVVRENRTYDQELGSLGKGAGDPSLNLFGDESAPNARELARRYATIDNFYADAEVSAQGWNWVVAANSNPYSEQTWPANYSGRNHPYPSENGDPAIAPNRDPANAYIWQRLANRGISFRNYGFYVGRNAAGQFVAQDPVLDANTDHAYTGYNLACPDSPDTRPAASPTCGTLPRFAEWQREFAQYEQNGNLPAVQFVRLPNDHTAGTFPGAPTPRVYVADNDWALGRLVDTVSHSRYWGSTAIFVTEDDAQNGPDHIDAHRTVALVVSPYSRTGRVDSTFYSTASMVRTIELLVGLGPMTQFDAYSTPMFASFTRRPDLAPYAAIMPTVPFNEVNTASSPLAEQSARQDLSTEDRIDEQLFNQAIWKSVKGADSTMPAPVHSLRTGPEQPSVPAGGGSGKTDGD